MVKTGYNILRQKQYPEVASVQDQWLARETILCSEVFLDPTESVTTIKKEIGKLRG